MSLLSQGPSPRWRQTMTGKADAGAGRRGRGITRPARSDSAGRAGTPSLSSSDLAAPAPASVIGRHRSTRGSVRGWTRPPGRLRTSARLQRRHWHRAHFRMRGCIVWLSPAHKMLPKPHTAPCQVMRLARSCNSSCGTALPQHLTTAATRKRKTWPARRREPATGPGKGTRRDWIDEQPAGMADNAPSSMRPAMLMPASAHRCAPSP